MRMPSPVRSALALTSAALVLTACGGGGNPLNSGSAPASGAAPSGTIVIGSANFPENQILAEIYGQALAAKGVTVDKKPNLGSREAYIPALQDGSIDLIPEYSGTLLQYFDKTATASDADAVYSALQGALPDTLIVLDKSAAEDKDAVVVTADTAAKYNAKTIADLAPHCGDLVFGGPPEFKQRVDGIPGIQKNYNCTFKDFRSLDAGGTLTRGALEKNEVQAGDIFTTDPAIPAKGWVALGDPKNNFIAQNVTPLINKAKATDTVKQVLNAVSAKLTTATLISLRNEAEGDAKTAPDVVAKNWLAQNPLG